MPGAMGVKKGFFRPRGATAFILALVLLLSWSAPGGDSCALAQEKRLRILHVNDFHGFAEPIRTLKPGEVLGGVAYLAGRASELRAADNVSSLFLAAGDMIQGHPWANMTKGKSSVELMNLLGVDVMVLGNHEFDFGPETLRDRIREMGFPVLGANVGGLDNILPYVLIEKGGVRVAVLGLVTPETPRSTHPDNVRGMTFADAAALCRRYMPQLKGKADVIVLLTHLGHLNDLELARECPGAHAVVGGHSHTRVDEPPLVGGTLVAQAWEHAKALGVVDFTVAADGSVQARGRLEMIRPGISKPDDAVAALVARYTKELEAAASEVLARTTVFLEGDGSRSRETNLGDLVADVVRERTGAQIALLNGGSIRGSLPAGAVRLQDLQAALPFDSFPVVVKMKGTEVRWVLEHGLARIEEGSGAFLQVSGLRIAFCPTAQSGKRLRRIETAKGPLMDEEEYTVVVNDFMAAGGDGFTLLRDLVGKDESWRGETIRDMVADFLRRRGEVAPVTDGRILTVED